MESNQSHPRGEFDSSADPVTADPVTRRQFQKVALACGAAVPFSGSAPIWAGTDDRNDRNALESTNDISAQEYTCPIPTYSIEPVIGDGKWISKDPPKESVGNYDTRTFDVTIGIEAAGTGNTKNFVATTVTPTAMPEQEVVSSDLVKSGCGAHVQPLTPGVSRLVVTASQISAGQVVSAYAKYRFRISKTYHGFNADTLSSESNFPTRFFGSWLGNSPGIQTHSSAVREISKELVKGKEHPFEWAQAFQKWVFENIKGKPMKYSSVSSAIKKGIGDCEERAGTFVALCRSVGIPARLVWVPNHAWAEFCLWDKEKRPHWIPAHTAAYNWFGWTGAHELVLQKGDRVKLPNNGKTVRLVADWLTWQGAKPKFNFVATIQPVSEENDKDAGPGARNKIKTGQWVLTGDHPDKKYLRR